MHGYIDNILYKLFKNINYLLIKLFKDKYKNADDLKDLQYLYYMYFVLELICLGTIKIYLSFIYKALSTFRNKTIIDLFLKRMFGLILSVLIYSDIILKIKNYFIEHGFIGLLYLNFLFILLNIFLFFI